MAPDPTQTAIENLIRDLAFRFGPRLKAVYSYGSSFGRGHHDARLSVLVLVDAIDADVIFAAEPWTERMREHLVDLVLDTPHDILRGADAFPILALTLIETRELLRGEDVLAELQTEPHTLRLGLERSLRAIHRDMLYAALHAGEGPILAREMRRFTRKCLFVFEGALILVGREAPTTREPDAILDAVVDAEILPEAHRERWGHVVSFANFREALDVHALRRLYAEVLQSLSHVIDVIDRFEA